ncbi:MAG: RICIN domain-containing protein [Pseudonocardiaceae bacterium]
MTTAPAEFLAHRRDVGTVTLSQDGGTVANARLDETVKPTCTRTADANWNLRRTVVTGPDGGVVYHIRNAFTGMCLDSSTSERRIGDASVIVQRLCLDEATSQVWKFDAVRRHAA